MGNSFFTNCIDSIIYLIDHLNADIAWNTSRYNERIPRIINNTTNKISRVLLHIANNPLNVIFYLRFISDIMEYYLSINETLDDEEMYARFYIEEVIDVLENIYNITNFINHSLLNDKHNITSINTPEFNEFTNKVQEFITQYNYSINIEKKIENLDISNLLYNAIYSLNLITIIITDNIYNYGLTKKEYKPMIKSLDNILKHTLCPDFYIQFINYAIRHKIDVQEDYWDSLEPIEIIDLNKTFCKSLTNIINFITEILYTEKIQDIDINQVSHFIDRINERISFYKK